MKQATMILTAVAVVLVCGLSHGKEPTEAAKQLKCYDGLIGTWRYEGPLLEDVPDVEEKGSDVVIQLTWRRILNRNVVETTWSIDFKEAETIAGKGLIGWNAAEKEIVQGGMNSIGAIGFGTLTVDDAAESFTLTSEGIDGEGEETSIKTIVTKKDKNTLTWRALERKGGLVEGPSPEYTFKKVERAKRAKKAK